METANFTVHRRARFVLQQLSSEEQNRVLDRLAYLADVPVAQWPPASVKKMAGKESLFLVQVDDQLRMIVRTDEGQPPEVLWIFLQGETDSLVNAARNVD
jgi:hypothetical protein